MLGQMLVSSISYHWNLSSECRRMTLDEIFLCPIWWAPQGYFSRFSWNHFCLQWGTLAWFSPCKAALSKETFVGGENIHGTLVTPNLDKPQEEDYSAMPWPEPGWGGKPTTIPAPKSGSGHPSKCPSWCCLGERICSRAVHLRAININKKNKWCLTTKG